MQRSFPATHTHSMRQTPDRRSTLPPPLPNTSLPLHIIRFLRGSTWTVCDVHRIVPQTIRNSLTHSFVLSIRFQPQTPNHPSSHPPPPPNHPTFMREIAAPHQLLLQNASHSVSLCPDVVFVRGRTPIYIYIYSKERERESPSTTRVRVRAFWRWFAFCADCRATGQQSAGHSVSPWPSSHSSLDIAVVKQSLSLSIYIFPHITHTHKTHTLKDTIRPLTIYLLTQQANHKKRMK